MCSTSSLLTHTEAHLKPQILNPISEPSHTVCNVSTHTATIHFARSFYSSCLFYLPHPSYGHTLCGNGSCCGVFFSHKKVNKLCHHKTHKRMEEHCSFSRHVRLVLTRRVVIIAHWIFRYSGNDTEGVGIF